MKLVPVLALPIWLARLRRREALEVVGILAAIGAGLLGWLVILGGSEAIPAMMKAVAFQVQRGSLSSFWNGIGWLQPAAQAALIAVVVAGTVAVIRDVRLRDDLPRLAALLAGIFLLSQLGANYWTWAYLPWAIVPALLVMAPVQAFREPAVARQAERASVDGRHPAPAVS
jgi:hypothetical protein